MFDGKTANISKIININNMGLFDSLPKSGSNFSFNDHLHGFATRLKEITRRGELHNLEDNIDGIIDILKDYSDYIRHGGLSYDQKQRVWLKIKRLESNLNRDDEREIKKLLDYLGK